VHIEDTKNGKPRDVPLSHRALEIIARRLLRNKGRMFDSGNENYISQRFTAERREIKGVEPFRFHDTRHTAATRLLQAGTDPRTVMEITGHSDLEMLMRYLHTDEQRKRAAIDAVEANSVHKTA
jgi:integrase